MLHSHIQLTRQGSNSVQVRHYNERVVLETLHRLGSASKADLAQTTRLTPQAVSAMVNALEKTGLIRSEGKRIGQVGPRSTLYTVAADGAYAIGLHVGRRALDAVLIDFSGEIVHQHVHEYDHPDPDAVIALAAGCVTNLRGSLPTDAQSRLIGVGVATPYFLGGWSDELGLPPTVSQAWKHIDFPTRLARQLNLPLFVENDGSSAATAELIYGIGRESRDFIYLFISTFIGGGLVIGGNVETGPHGNSGAFGPLPVSASHLSSVAPPKGPFEILLRRASTYVLFNHLRAHGILVNRAHELTDLGDGAEPYLSEWIADCADALAQAIISAISVVDVSTIVIDGALPAPVLRRVVTAVAERFIELQPEGVVTPEIRLGTRGVQAAAIGGATLPLYAMFAPDSQVLVKPRSGGDSPQRGGQYFAAGK